MCSQLHSDADPTSGHETLDESRVLSQDDEQHQHDAGAKKKKRKKKKGLYRCTVFYCLIGFDTMCVYAPYLSCIFCIHTYTASALNFVIWLGKHFAPNCAELTLESVN